MTIQWIGLVGAVVMVDLALSGDNALVIGAAASKLRGAQRRLALVFGGVVAMVLRIVLTIAAVFLLRIPFLELIGGVLVLCIAMGLVRDLFAAEATLAGDRRGATRFVAACAMIVVADISMSLDNVLAIAALAHNNLFILVLGLVVSVGLLLLASSAVAALMERFPLFVAAASGILAWTAATMILRDQGVAPYLARLDALVPGPLPVYIDVACFVLVAIAAAVAWMRHTRQIPDLSVATTIKRR